MTWRQRIACFFGYHQWGDVRSKGLKLVLGPSWTHWSQCKYCRATHLFRG